MKYSTSKNELQSALQKLSKAVPNRSTLPILSCVLIDVNSEKTTLRTTDLEITVSQDPNEPDMSTSFFSSNVGAFNFNNITIGQTIGFASLSAAGGDINFNANLIVDVQALSANVTTVVGEKRIHSDKPVFPPTQLLQLSKYADPPKSPLQSVTSIAIGKT